MPLGTNLPAQDGESPKLSHVSRGLLSMRTAGSPGSDSVFSITLP